MGSIKEKNDSLSKQVFLLSIDSSAFLTDEEKAIFDEQMDVTNFKNEFLAKSKIVEESLKDLDSINKYKNELKEFKKKKDPVKNDRDKLKQTEEDYRKNNYAYFEYRKDIREHKKELNNVTDSLKQELKEQLNNFEGIRKLRINDNLCYIDKDGRLKIKPNNVITVFDSILTRLIGCKEKKMTLHLVVIKNFHYPVMNNLIKNGFNFGNIHYVYLSSSSGQIKDHKMVFIRESTLNKKRDDGTTIEDTLMCGLTREVINAYEDKDGHHGVNPNKYNSYLSLASSASHEWKDFPIDNILIVPDYETQVTDKFDVIEKGTDDKYRLDKKYGQELTVPVESFDGFGVIDKSLMNEPFIFRAPWCKGLLAPVPLKQFFNDNKDEKGELWIEDVWGKSHNVIAENMKIIMTSSQMKMWRYYLSQKDFQEKFINNHCEAAIVTKNDVRENVNLNYQFLQTLDLMDEEIHKLTNEYIEEFKQLGTNKEIMLKYLDADEESKHKNYFRQALSMYNELLNDDYSKQCIMDKKAAMIKDFKSGKFPIDGYHNVYILPDVYNFLSRLIGEDEHLLNQDEVSCSLFDDGEELDVLRSPHLYIEHAIQTNKVDENNELMKDYFCTNGLYISNKSSITLLIMADFDGDHISITSNRMLIEAAKRQKMDFNIHPLYYEMFSSKPKKLTDDVIFENLKSAYTQNIGIISNNISKVLNSKKPDMDIVRYLTCRNNFTIDYSKTLKQVEFTDDVEKDINKYINNGVKVPYFFKYAKDKKENQVTNQNESTVNRIGKLMDKNKYTISFQDVGGRFDYSMLMSKDINFGIRAKEIIKRFDDLAKNFKYLKPSDKDIDEKKHPQTYAYYFIRKELRKFTKNEDYITNVLVKYLYQTKASKYKTTLWRCYGKYIVDNLKYNLEQTKECKKCGARIAKKQGKQYCNKCSNRMKKESKMKSAMRKQAV